MKHADVKLSMYIDLNKENNKEDPKFKVGDHVRISKYKSIFAKGYVPNWSEEGRGHMLLVTLKPKKLLE